MSSTPLVGILMGSDSDLPVMVEAKKVLEEFGIAHEMHIYSAHRAPKSVIEYSETAESRGLKVLIAGAGVAAHLAGVLASSTVLPVIGIPLASGALGGIDSLLSTVQMPSGVPVATVAINGAKNAALLAVQILGTSDKALRERFSQYKRSMQETLLNKDENLPSLLSELIRK